MEIKIGWPLPSCPYSVGVIGYGQSRCIARIETICWSPIRYRNFQWGYPSIDINKVANWHVIQTDGEAIES